MPKKIIPKGFSFFVIFILLVGFDQLSKHTILMFSKQSFFWEKYFWLSSKGVVCNSNIAWGIKLGNNLFFILWEALFLAIIWFFYKTKNFFLILVISGAFSNLIDRITRSCVIDFIKLGNFPAFNFADVLINAGLALFVLSFITKTNKIN